jgi:hypothetical protein
MTLHRAIRLGGLPLGKLCRSLVLPLLLLVAQHGALLHELSHAIAPQTQDESDPPTSSKHPCQLCLAFAQIQSTATATDAIPVLLTGLTFAPSVASVPATLAAELPSQRNRGPPAFL